ncbi:hypothetical protein DdX_21106 [Ditylenchus destructor]|uniref:Uncharacterized protein n=1 Tax=Ditylenchus destructor TaxID=166010 RepID=A0AAD4QT90_9BILA|nr:hypothetical protein DdX_21106 [Ditylenchus destructor]
MFCNNSQQVLDSCSAYNNLDDQHFSKYFHLNPIIPNDNDDHKWFFEFSVKNLLDLYKDTAIRIGKYLIDVAPENQEGYAMVETWFKYGVQGGIEAYNNKEEQCLILSHGDTRLGIFYKIVGKTLNLYQPFLLRQLIHDGFAVPLSREVLWKRMYPHCNKIDFMVLQDLLQPYANVIKALSARGDTP